MDQMVFRPEWPVGRDVTMEFRCRRGSLVKVTVHASSDPIDKDEAVSMATEAITTLAGDLAPSQDERSTKPTRLDNGELFRSWAVREH